MYKAYIVLHMLSYHRCKSCRWPFVFISDESKIFSRLIANGKRRRNASDPHWIMGEFRTHRVSWYLWIWIGFEYAHHLNCFHFSFKVIRRLRQANCPNGCERGNSHSTTIELVIWTKITHLLQWKLVWTKTGPNFGGKLAPIYQPTSSTTDNIENNIHYCILPEPTCSDYR